MTLSATDTKSHSTRLEKIQKRLSTFKNFYYRISIFKDGIKTATKISTFHIFVLFSITIYYKQASFIIANTLNEI